MAKTQLLLTIHLQQLYSNGKSHLKSAGRLQGLAKMTLLCGTLCAAAHLSSCTLAQSKPAPSAFSMATCGNKQVQQHMRELDSAWGTTSFSNSGFIHAANNRHCRLAGCSTIKLGPCYSSNDRPTAVVLIMPGSGNLHAIRTPQQTASSCMQNCQVRFKHLYCRATPKLTMPGSGLHFTA
jgi:hypothetical protein